VGNDHACHAPGYRGFCGDAQAGEVNKLKGCRAQASRRTWTAKADGKLRPLGIAAIEDKIVQQAVVKVLSAIYEEEFLGFSYGFRPGRKKG
jgi:retron-type reverse transcriptase